MRTAFIIIALALLAACTQPVVEKTGETLEGADQIVTINNFKFSPQVITVKLGDTVAWKNQDQASHTVALPGIESPELFKDDVWTHTFTEPGVFDYICGIHPSMSGQVIVEAG